MKIFVTGNSRSGTTMMGRVLNNHSQVYTFQELHFFDELITGSELDKEWSREKAERIFSLLMSIENEGYFGERKVDRYKGESIKVLHGSNTFKSHEVLGLFLNYKTHLEDKKHACDQTPQNIFFAQEILQSFNDAKIIVMVRDPRDVLLSQKNKWKRKKLAGDHFPVRESIRAWVNYHPYTISRLWNSVTKEAASLSDDTRVLKVRFEDLTKDPEATIKKVCVHLGLEFQTSMLKVPKVGSSNIKDAGTDHSIDASRSGRWKDGGLSDTEIYICESINRDQMAVNDYEPSTASFNIFAMLYVMVVFPVKSAAAIFFNLHRLRDPVSVFKRLFR